MSRCTVGKWHRYKSGRCKREAAPGRKRCQYHLDYEKLYSKTPARRAWFRDYVKTPPLLAYHREYSKTPARRSKYAEYNARYKRKKKELANANG